MTTGVWSLVWLPDGALVARKPDDGVDGSMKFPHKAKEKLTKARDQKMTRLLLRPGAE